MTIVHALTAIQKNVMFLTATKLSVGEFKYLKLLHAI